jgi:hypothetical protein
VTTKGRLLSPTGPRSEHWGGGARIAENRQCAQKGETVLYQLCLYNLGLREQNTLLDFFYFLVPPKPPYILDPNGRRVGSLIGPYDEGEPLAITCMSSSGNFCT